MENHTTVICYYANGDECPSRLATTSPDQPCTRKQWHYFQCGPGVRCHYDEIYESEYCPGGTATPTPTPEPSPTPTPSPGSGGPGGGDPGGGDPGGGSCTEY